MSHYDAQRTAEKLRTIHSNLALGWPTEERIDNIGQNGNNGEHCKDAVEHPSHYKVLDLECIEMIAGSLTIEGFKGYCLGCWMKYRFRAGNKGELQQDIDKSGKYTSLFEEYKHLCKPPF